MKITYITPSGVPSKQANTIQVMKMCEAFSQQGHDVELLCPSQSSESVTDVFAHYDVEEIFKIRQLPWRPFKGYQFTVIASLVAYRSGADIVYGRSIAGCYFSALLGLNIVYESHLPADDIHLITNQMFRSIVSSPNLVSLVVITEALKDYYTYRYEIERNVCVAPDAAACQDGTPIDEIQNVERQQAGYVGHLYEGKGIELIVKLAREVSDVDFHVVGGTDDDLEKWRSRVEDMSNIKFHGYVPPARVEDYLASFDVLLAPYQREVHGAGGKTDISKWMSPLKIFEYMSAGKPIVCSDLPVLREVLTHGENALLCDPEDITAWGKALRKLQTDPKLREFLIENAQSDFNSKHSYGARAERIIKIIHDSRTNW